MNGLMVPAHILREISNHAPDGYLEDCLSIGTLSQNGLSIVFTQEQYATLVAKYGSIFSPVFASVEKKHVALSRPASRHTRCLAGTALRALLSRFGINADEKGCRCRSHAAHMDAAGCDWCEQNVDTIVAWLREEATKRRLPFLDAAGRMLVRRAIRNARRAAQA